MVSNRTIELLIVISANHVIDKLFEVFGIFKSMRLNVVFQLNLQF